MEKVKKYIIDNRELMNEWDYIKNNDIKDSLASLTTGSNKKVWWICNQNHSYEAIIYDRCKGQGCPYCSNKKVLKGYNDFATKYPELLKEWDYEKNDILGIKPDEIVLGGKTKFWWKCKNGHEYQSIVYDRIKSKGCPYCSDKKLLKGYNDFATKYPELLKEWDFEKNNELGVRPDEIIGGGHQKIWWKCNKGHEWKTEIYPRIEGSGCPYCAGQKAIQGINDFETLHPEMLKEWDYEENNKLGIKPNELLVGSIKKVHWICSKGHKYNRSIYDRLNGRGNCPYCTKRIVKSGINDLSTTNPELIKEWDYEKNKELGIEPNEIATTYNKKVWWKCSKGHSWNALIYPRLKGVGCPYCSNNKVIEGFNDLTTTNPEILKYWNKEKNIKMKPSMFSHGSTKTVWWKCEKGHEWKAIISEISRGNRCPYCSNQRILTGYNDLATQYPEVLQYWDYDKNEKLPTELAKTSKYKAWWKCQKGHSYQMTVAVKVRGNYHSCPICNKYKRVSLPEKIIYYYLSKAFNNIEENYQPEWIKPKELDIYLNDLRIGIEYDGFRYHKDINQDLSKDFLCEQNGIKLIRVREKECPDYISSAMKVKLKESYNSRYKYIEDALKELQRILNIKIDINIENDFDDILKLIYIGNKNNCIAISNPEVLDEWDYDENEKIGISPFNVSKGTSLKANWICNKGHKYKASIAIKTNQHTGCPYCNGRKILHGFNDLATTNPELIKEWDYEKNIKTPEQVSKFDIKKYHWKCEKGHEYLMSISAKTTQNSGCPICSGHRILEGFNDIKSNYPDLIKEWDYIKNNKEAIYPEKETKGSEKKVWWICKNGHSYKARISGRIIKGNGCPICAGKKVLAGFNDIATTNPELLKEWNYEKNTVKPDEVSKGTSTKVWWICSKSHSYQAKIPNRIKGTKCPYCSGNKILVGFNDLATTYPEVLNNWDYEKNEKMGITPNNVSKSCSKKVWWKCEKGHSYLREIYNQRNGYGRCPICKKNK